MSDSDCSNCPIEVSEGCRFYDQYYGCGVIIMSSMQTLYTPADREVIKQALTIFEKDREDNFTILVLIKQFLEALETDCSAELKALEDYYGR